MDEQTLNAGNDWFYAWEMLDPSDDYIVLELNEYDRFTTTVESTKMENYMYWSIIGEDDLESHMNDEDFKVILTEAAQEASGSLGDTKEANGWVIIGTSDGVETKQVRLSQIATLDTKDNADGTSTYFGTYGVTSQSEIDKLGSGAIWYLEDAGSSDVHSNSESGSLEAFYLYCKLDDVNYYLALDNGSQNLITSTDKKAIFYYDAMGELMIQLSDVNAVRVEILGDGTISLDEAEMAAATDDIRIYTYTSTPSLGNAYTITNTEVPETPEEPEVPETPEEPEEPEVPETPEEPEEPETPETPDEPEEPEIPEAPDEPETTEEPVIPDTPDEPETPEEPDEPEMPGTSEETEEPATPEIPDEQVTPDTSDETESSDSGSGLPQTGVKWNLLVCIVMLAIGGVMLLAAGTGMMSAERKRKK